MLGRPPSRFSSRAASIRSFPRSVSGRQGAARPPRSGTCATASTLDWAWTRLDFRLEGRGGEGRAGECDMMTSEQQVTTHEANAPFLKLLLRPDLMPFCATSGGSQF
jgi:hypothetical protein